jgi:hypothetical protein
MTRKRKGEIWLAYLKLDDVAAYLAWRMLGEDEIDSRAGTFTALKYVANAQRSLVDELTQ